MGGQKPITPFPNDDIFGQKLPIRKFVHRFEGMLNHRLNRVGNAMRRTYRRIGRIPIVDATNAPLFPYLVGNINDILFGCLKF